MTPHSPSRLAAWLLAQVVPERDREAVLGDLAEEYALRARSETPSAAARWYWGQVGRSIPRVAWASLRQGRWIHTLAVAFGIYLAAGLLEFAGTMAIAKLLTPGEGVFRVLSLVVGLTTIVLGGYAAAWIRPGAARALAGLVMIAVVVLMVTMSGSGSAPLWYALAFLVIGPLAALGGERICVSKRRTGRAP